MAQLDRDATTACTPCRGDSPVGHSNNRGSMPRAVILSCMKAADAQNRVTTHPEARGNSARNRGKQSALLFANTGGFVEASLAAPPHKLRLGFAIAVNASVKKVARLTLTGGSAPVSDDDVKLIRRAHFAVELKVITQGPQIILRRAGRNAG